MTSSVGEKHRKKNNLASGEASSRYESSSSTSHLSFLNPTESSSSPVSFDEVASSSGLKHETTELETESANEMFIEQHCLANSINCLSQESKESLILSKLPPATQWQEGLKIFCDSEEPPVVLVDMDNTIVNWELQFERLMTKHHPQIPIVPPLKRTEFKIELNYKDEYRGPILHLTSLDEFWYSMDPVPGAIQAIHDMVSMGLIIFIVTTPDARHSSRSALEKIAWVEKHLGTEWKYRSILTTDKTLVKGDILIDDKPAASTGLLQPSWTHALFDQPYNRQHTTCPRLSSWSEWGITLYQILVYRERLKHHLLTLSNAFSIAFPNDIRHQRAQQKQQLVNAENNFLQEMTPHKSTGFSHLHGLPVTSQSYPSSPRLNQNGKSCCDLTLIHSPVRNSVNFSRLLKQ